MTCSRDSLALPFLSPGTRPPRVRQGSKTPNVHGHRRSAASPDPSHATTAIGGRGFARRLPQAVGWDRTPRHPRLHGTPRPSTNRQKRTFPRRGNPSVLQGTQCIQFSQASSLSPAKAKWNGSTSRSDACPSPPTPPQLQSQFPAAGSTPSLPRSIRRGAARDPTPPTGDGQDGIARAGTPPEYGGAFLPATHNRPKSGKCPLRSASDESFVTKPASVARLRAHMSTCLQRYKPLILFVYIPTLRRLGM